MGRSLWSRMGFETRQAETLPWYRAKNYDGNLAESEKRQFDAFRSLPKHPAALSEELPEEVQSYINRIELELYDAKQSEAAIGFVAAAGFGIALMAINYVERIPASDLYYFVGGGIVAYSWFRYGRVWRRNADELHPSSEQELSRTDEALRREWELEYITKTPRRGASDLEG